MAISKIILNGVTQIDLTADTVEASNLLQSYTAHKNDGTQVTGTATGGADMPTFTVTWDSNYTQILSVTCDKTYAEVSSYFQNGKNSGLVNETNNGVDFYTLATNMDEPTGTDFTYFVLINSTGGSYDLVYHSNGTITATFPSSHYETLNITSNGTYQPSASLGIINEVNVNVPQPSGSINITSNGTHDVTNYASAVVNVSGGSSSWTKVAETSYQVSTTSTSASTVATWATGHNEIVTSEKIIYVRIRDTAGKRASYFYGSDNFFIIDPSLPSSTTASGRSVTRVNSSGVYANGGYGGTTGYGVYADTLYSDGRIRIRSRYSSSASFTVNGTYSVQIYLLDPPTGAPIFT